MSEGGWTKQEGESYAIYYNNCVEECLNNYYYFTCCLSSSAQSATAGTHHTSFITHHLSHHHPLPSIFFSQSHSLSFLSITFHNKFISALRYIIPYSTTLIESYLLSTLQLFNMLTNQGILVKQLKAIFPNESILLKRRREERGKEDIVTRKLCLKHCFSSHPSSHIT